MRKKVKGRNPTLFSYYGGKARICKKYTPPAYSKIIEPFAGGAAYSLLYYDREVILIDKNPRVAAVWRYLLSTSVEEILRLLPKEISKGDRISHLIQSDWDLGLVEFMRAHANLSTFGIGATWDVVTKIAAERWYLLKPRLEYWLPRIRHWRFIEGSYDTVTNQTATWFIDPPYSNSEGRLYQEKVLDYQSLGDWCKSREGQVIVCENEGATWLPFCLLKEATNHGYGKVRNREVVYEQ